MSENEPSLENYQLTKKQMDQIQFLMQCQRFESLGRFIDQLLRYEYFRMDRFIKIKDSAIYQWDVELFKRYDRFFR